MLPPLMGVMGIYVLVPIGKNKYIQQTDQSKCSNDNLAELPASISTALQMHSHIWL